MPNNPRPSRKAPKRRPTPRVAGRPAPGQTSSSEPVESTQVPADPADGTPDLADGTPDLADRTPDLADRTPEVADGTPEPADGTPEAADGTPEVADGTPEAADGTPEVAESPDAADADKPKPAPKRPVSRVSTLRPGDGAAAPTAPESAISPGSRPGGSRRRATVVVMAAIAAVLGIFALIAGLHPGADIGPNKAFVDRPATTELTSQVQSKACALTVNTVDVDKWAEQARAVLTGEALTEFDQYLPQQREILGQTQAVAECRVETVGVADLSGGGDGDTARVVVNMIVSQQQAGIAGQSAAPRYQFGMVKQGDAWLINKVEAF
ncbi:hypothetical protein VZC37_12925 [Gordonia sp. LSe1-13]|uniref:Mce-associated membrane protein n=1 Tax=Gordonia sesuvii TaxID=3116777 RepID=A0ABU7MDR6_9ACTN|nr:hypothetical protein [Gordonia sp. LSe1-13]